MNTGALPPTLSKLIGWFSVTPAEPISARLLRDIPATFSEEQADAVLDLEVIAARDQSRAGRRLRECTPSLFTRAQAECVRELLSLDPWDLRATLADAMEPCELRDRLAFA
ncbi:hypothetical protein QTI24_12535 [Variovorax sp. J22P240]|uniref:hypothetical protein n=1 Tax=unclassified Variovorax TaxID=663243 RepID=UPI002574FEE3|nr:MULTISPECIES: hypothetical protein [unclassified Variovorax]MDL9999438.1 hypothetical protein [Variovorax sp. J22P240]MDM0052443.1 hypothetical protein [Variovorax sp. J22R115]